MFSGKKCKYHKRCEEFNPTSFTCTKNQGIGGSLMGCFCGKFQEFENQKLPIEQQKLLEVLL